MLWASVPKAYTLYTLIKLLLAFLGGLSTNYDDDNPAKESVLDSDSYVRPDMEFREVCHRQNGTTSIPISTRRLEQWEVHQKRTEYGSARTR